MTKLWFMLAIVSLGAAGPASPGQPPCAETFAHSISPTSPTQSIPAHWKVASSTIEGPLEEQDQYILSVKLGKIGEKEFTQLHSALGTKPSRAYSREPEYSLTDFLPPFLKPVPGMRYVEHTSPTPANIAKIFSDQGKKIEPEIYSNANCHSLTWQWINHRQGKTPESLSFLQVDGERLYAELPASGKVAMEDLAAGDVIFVRGSTLQQTDEILHSAIYLGNGLILEKGNPGADYPYRIAYLKDLKTKFESSVDDTAFLPFRASPDQPPLASIAEAHSITNPENMRAHSLDPQATPVDSLKEYGLSAQWDSERNEELFVVFHIASTKTVGKTHLVPALKNQ